MIVFLCIIAGLSYLGTVGESDSNKEAAKNYTLICVASIVALAIITIYQK
ncbi:hypothetical protein ACM1RC_27375 [Paenibacillus azoreducens]